MTTLKEVEAAIEKLPTEELIEFNSWFGTFKAKRLPQEKEKSLINHLLSAPKGEEIDTTRDSQDFGRDITI